MIVFIAGMPRSGSTFSFNIARELLVRRGTVYQEAASSILPLIERSSKADHILLKAHSVDAATIRLVQLGAIKTICTIRRPEDAIASWMETFGFSLNDAIRDMIGWLKMFAQLREYAMVVDYNIIIRRPLRAAYCITGNIFPDASKSEIISIARKYTKIKVKAITDKIAVNDEKICDIGFSYYDTTTFFHRNHVSMLAERSGAERIGSEAVALIRKELHSYVDESGDLQ